MKKTLAIVCALCIMLAAARASFAAPKNVILMVADGWGYNDIMATNYWTGTTQAYQGSDWTHYAMSTYSANGSGYDPAQAWSGGTINQSYVKNGATDSASAITAMVTGVKNYNGQINIATNGSRLTNFAEMYKTNGRAAGTVSTVHWSHATPAGLGAHNTNRNDYAGIANEMIYSSGLDVIMGAGNPFYNDNGQIIIPTSSTYARVGGQATWEALVNGTTDYALITDRAQFQAMATGATPNKVVGTFNCATTAQQSRSGYSSSDVPGSDPFNAGIPTMSELALASLNVLDNNSNGFFVMMEGGAIDWANHANQNSRTIEEMKDFNAAVNSVIDWVSFNSSWSDTLLIVTGDHECGLITGPGGALDVADNGAGVMPGMQFNCGSHTNMLVPLFAKGSGSELFANYAVNYDPVRGYYIDNTDIFKVMTGATGINSVPEPGSILALCGGIAGLIGYGIGRRKWFGQMHFMGKKKGSERFMFFYPCKIVLTASIPVRQGPRPLPPA